MIFIIFYNNKMTRRNKKSTAKKPKGSKSGISINIKNIMKQVQNERPRQDFINLSGKKPMDNLEMGNMSRLQLPAATYASRPLSQFPSLASLSNVTREFAPPLSQLTSKSTPPLGGGAPIFTPAQDKQNDVLEGFRPSVKAVASNPVVPTKYGPEYVPTSVFEGVSATGTAMDPRVASGSLASYIGEPRVMDESQYLVAHQMDPDATPPYFGTPPATPRGAKPVKGNPLRERERGVRVPEELLSSEALSKRLRHKEYQQTRAAGPGQPWKP
jgi:hypothetical protein